MISTNRISDIFFDLDHTLWDFEKNSALTFKLIFEKLNYSIQIDDFLAHYNPINQICWKLYRDNKISQKEFDSLKKELVGLVSGIVLVLKEKPYFMSDEFTLVDCYMSAILYRLPYLGVSTPKSKSFDSLYSYQDKLFARPSF